MSFKVGVKNWYINCSMQITFQFLPPDTHKCLKTKS